MATKFGPPNHFHVLTPLCTREEGCLSEIRESDMENEDTFCEDGRLADILLESCDGSMVAARWQHLVGQEQLLNMPPILKNPA